MIAFNILLDLRLYIEHNIIHTDKYSCVMELSFAVFKPHRDDDDDDNVDDDYDDNDNTRVLY